LSLAEEIDYQISLRKLDSCTYSDVEEAGEELHQKFAQAISQALRDCLDPIIKATKDGYYRAEVYCEPDIDNSSLSCSIVVSMYPAAYTSALGLLSLKLIELGFDYEVDSNLFGLNFNLRFSHE